MPLVNGTGHSPSLGQPTPGVVKQGKSSGGSVGVREERNECLMRCVGYCSGWFGPGRALQPLLFPQRKVPMTMSLKRWCSDSVALQPFASERQS